MPLLLRTSMEKKGMRKVATILLHLASVGMLGGVPAAAVFYSTGAMALAGLAVAPSRR